MDELDKIKTDLAQLVRLSLSEQVDDVRLFVARLVRKYRASEPQLAGQLDLYLRNRSTRTSSPLRRVATPTPSAHHAMPIDDDSRLALLRVFNDPRDFPPPLFPEELSASLTQLVEERRQTDRLLAAGLQPSRSAIFVGPPGVGKSMTARWLAAQLGVPLYVLDLTAVMSSLLGKSGSNLRSALDFAKRVPCVLFLDEIDAIAKRRSDDADVGELKRLVNVILQEVDNWPSTSLLVAATNHPELIDPALWRRFDMEIKFELPDQVAIKEAMRRFLGNDLPLLAKWIDVLSHAFKGSSISDIERSIQKFRRTLALGTASDAAIIEEFIRGRTQALERSARIDLAVMLAKTESLSQHVVSDLTGVSRDTIRKYLSETTKTAKGNKKI
ncbi:AAA family ATPase [Duganella phyllosphaerae]|uniref:ATP-dependent zinc metalloprotease FtsH n=1 Tax=Duganella phyllosphaerae TaxID=762836 RepID=A0A1E7WJC3_9BURK|nr:ATP-binding protein [Duganella phyllosphaerae]OEZ98750.1 ATP-dependent zinc metalloprotease FtsH [Duganella phyllosphaerae]